MEKFNQRNAEMCQKMYGDSKLQSITEDFMDATNQYEYCYHFTWMGVPIIQYPADIIAFQEVVYNVKPDYIIETGIARGGSVIFHASLLELIGNKHGKVIGVDIDIREHTTTAVSQHALGHRVEMIEGSSTDQSVVDKIKKIIPHGSKVLVVLDSNHTHEHVLKELELYSPFVCNGSYIIVTGTVCEFVENKYASRAWGKGNNPYTAVVEFLSTNKSFEIDSIFDQKLLISDSKYGFLKKICND